jgi:ATP-dependent protease ClpP protease subunit
MTVDMREFFITFLAPITSQSVYNLYQIIENRKRVAPATHSKYTKLTISISSPGGSLLEALNAYRYLANSGLEVNTHAFGLVASAGLVLYCIGKKRTADSRSCFYIHPSTQAISNNVLDMFALDGIRNISQYQDSEGVNILSKATGKTEGAIKEHKKKHTVFSAEEAKDFGLVTEVNDFAFTQADIESFFIGEFDKPIPTAPDITSFAAVEKMMNSSTHYSGTIAGQECATVFKNDQSMALDEMIRSVR